MAGRFEGKVALLAGAGAAVEGEQMGFGGVAAWRILREGGSVLIGDIQDERGERAVQQMRDEGLNATYRHLDVTGESDWAASVDQIMADHGRLDIMVDIAGILDGGTLEDVSVDLWKKTMDVTSHGMFFGARAVAPAMRKNGGGSIVLISSMVAKVVGEYGSAYAASRAGMAHFARAAAVQLARDGIRVNSVMPGWTRTPFTEALYQDEGPREWRNRRVPLGRWAQPEEIANGILFLASDDSSYVTGTELLIDGGVTAWWGPID
jgi:NAD(P)-dependent dehydrogenase (short-subunit alcohol dehydrogenase family)